MPSRPRLQAWAKTVGPSPSMCSLKWMPGLALATIDASVLPDCAHVHDVAPGLTPAHTEVRSERTVQGPWLTSVMPAVAVAMTCNGARAGIARSHWRRPAEAHIAKACPNHYLLWVPSLRTPGVMINLRNQAVCERG